MFQSRLNQHLTLIAMMLTLILVMKLIRTILLCEDAVVLQGPSPFGN